MTIFEKYMAFAHVARVISELYDTGKTAEQIVEETKLPKMLVDNIIAIKKIERK